MRLASRCKSPVASGASASSRWRATTWFSRPSSPLTRAGSTRWRSTHQSPSSQAQPKTVSSQVASLPSSYLRTTVHSHPPVFIRTPPTLRPLHARFTSLHIPIPSHPSWHAAPAPSKGVSRAMRHSVWAFEPTGKLSLRGSSHTPDSLMCGLAFCEDHLAATAYDHPSILTWAF